MSWPVAVISTSLKANVGQSDAVCATLIEDY